MFISNPSGTRVSFFRLCLVSCIVCATCINCYFDFQYFFFHVTIISLSVLSKKLVKKFFKKLYPVGYGGLRDCFFHFVSFWRFFRELWKQWILCFILTMVEIAEFFWSGDNYIQAHFYWKLCPLEWWIVTFLRKEFQTESCSKNECTKRWDSKHNLELFWY